MLSRSSYDQEHVDDSRGRVAAQVAAFRALAAAAEPYVDDADGSLGAALTSFEPVFFNNMILVLDQFFVHRGRGIEGKDGNPLNEVRVLCNSIMHHDAVMAKDSQIRLDPAKSVLRLEPGDEIRVSESYFTALADAYFAEIEQRYVEA